MRLSQTTRKKQNGFTLPAVLIFVLIFLAVPLVFWYSTLKPDNAEVKGTETSNPKEGTNVHVVSQLGSWELSEYLCKTKDECTSSLTGGKKWEAISGGATKGNTTKINYSTLWKDYKYFKFFVKPGWGSSPHDFSLKDAPDVSDSFSKVFDNVPVFVLPINVIQSNQFVFLTFTDKL